MFFSKPVFDLHSFNARIVGTGEGGRAWYLQPEPWNTVGGLIDGCMTVLIAAGLDMQMMC